ncbi:MAG: RDD family protein [Saprospiraceae bacterium]|nr:RDD family protein [Saprospiraceae bacterium]
MRNHAAMSIMQLLYRRIFASIIDYGIIGIYGIFLFLLTQSIASECNLNLNIHPFESQLIGFLCLTLPVFLYSYLTEKSNWKGTIGKRILNINVTPNPAASHDHIFLRNLLKYLPWELAHTGVHWTIYYSQKEMELALWIWGLLMGPQIIAIVYFASIVKTKGERSVYDEIAKTKICIINSN